jgi:hypothetical protein
VIPSAVDIREERFFCIGWCGATTFATTNCAHTIDSPASLGAAAAATPIPPRLSHPNPINRIVENVRSLRGRGRAKAGQARLNANESPLCCNYSLASLFAFFAGLLFPFGQTCRICTGLCGDHFVVWLWKAIFAMGFDPIPNPLLRDCFLASTILVLSFFCFPRTWIGACFSESSLSAAGAGKSCLFASSILEHDVELGLNAETMFSELPICIFIRDGFRLPCNPSTFEPYLTALPVNAVGRGYTALGSVNSKDEADRHTEERAKS